MRIQFEIKISISDENKTIYKTIDESTNVLISTSNNL